MVWFFYAERNLTANNTSQTSLLLLYVYATGLSEDELAVSFNFSTDVLTKLRGSFSSLITMLEPIVSIKQSYLLSFGRLGPALSSGTYNTTDIVSDLMTGAMFMHSEVTMKDLVSIYSLNITQSFTNKVEELSTVNTGLNRSQLAVVLGLSEIDIRLVENVTVQDLTDVGISVLGNSLKDLMALALHIGEILFSCFILACLYML